MAQRLRRVAVQQLVQDADVAHRLGHLGAAHVEHAVVQPEAREQLAAVGAGALRDFVLVVRELQVHAAGMDVDGLAQVRGGHRRALDVPAGPAQPPGRVPARLGRVGGLPQHEVAGIALVRGHLDARAREHLVHRPARELAVVGVAGDREQHVAVGGIGVAAVDQGLDHGDDLRDVGGGVRLDVLRGDPKPFHVLSVDGGEAVGDLGDRHAQRLRGGVDLVVHVGDVAGVEQPRMAPPQQSGQHVEDHRPAGVADVHVVVDRGSAQVHRHAVRVERREGFQAAVQVVVQAQFHRRSLAKQAAGLNGKLMSGFRCRMLQ